MNNIYQKLDEILKNSSNVIILSHLSADLDAISSCFLLKEILNNYYPNLKADFRLQFPVSSEIARLEYISIDNKNLVQSANDIDWKDYDSVVIVDMSRFTNLLIDLSPEMINGKKVVFIDHHDTGPDIQHDLLVNDHMVSSTEQIFSAFYEILGDKLLSNVNIAKYTQLGIISDSYNFLYEKTSGNTYKIMGTLRDVYKIDAMKILKSISINTKPSLKILAKVLENTKFKDDMCYSFIPPEFTESKDYTNEDISCAYTTFVDLYARNIEGVNWCFIIKKSSSEENKWKISFRSIDGACMVNKIAEKFGGGGHVNSSGGAVEAETADQAINKILKECFNK